MLLSSQNRILAFCIKQVNFFFDVGISEINLLWSNLGFRFGVLALAYKF